MEARVASNKPIAVTHRGPNIDEAIHGAAAKLKRTLTTGFARSQAHR